MMRFRYFLSAVVVLAALGFLLPHAKAAGTDEAQKYVEGLGNQALTAIANKNANKEQKRAKLEKLFSENVDFPWVGRFVMGRFWRQASEAQKSHYLREYQHFLIMHYTARFTE